MGFFGMVIKPGKDGAVMVPPGWFLQLCTAALEPPTKKQQKSQDVSATLWLQAEGEPDGISYLIGTLQCGGQSAQLSLTHCLTEVDGKVTIEVRGNGVVHLTGFFSRKYDDLDSDEGDSSSGEDSKELTSSDMRAVMNGQEEEVEEESESEDDIEEDDGEMGRTVSEEIPSSEASQRRQRAAAIAALMSYSTGGGDAEESDEDSEDDGEYMPEDSSDMEEGEDEDSDEGSDADEEDGSEQEPEIEDEASRETVSGKKPETESGNGASGATAKRGAAKEREEANDGSSAPPPSKKTKSEPSASETALTQDGPKASTASSAEASSEREMTKAERKKLRKRENKRKAAEAKRGLEEAFSAREDDDKEDPVGVPLKSPRTKALRGGLKIKDTVLGGGKVAVPGKNVKVCYEGCFPDGRVFDKNQNRRRPLQFRVGMKKVIVGMDRGIEGMRVGGSREISIPAALGYGARGTGPIPPNQDLVFRVELVDVLGK